jgi:signal transduction histidine kinase
MTIARAEARGSEMFDLGNFTLGDMTELGSVLRQMGDGAASMEEMAGRTVRYLYEHLVEGPSDLPCCALVRFFKTHRFDGLDPDLRESARGMLRGRPEADRMKCLTLLATAGDRAEWNSRHTSVAHKAIPLASEDLVAQAPMISSLLGQLGVEVTDLLNPSPELLVEPDASFNIFHVPCARGSPQIPAQREFVELAGVESVLGFGGMLPLGDIFVVILFLKTRVPRETAELFRTLALNLKMATLPFDESVFGGPEEARQLARHDQFDSQLRRLKARIGTLGQLLQVYERSVLDQSKRLYTEQERMRFQTTLLASQGEASLDGLLSTSLDGTVIFANQRFADIWGVEPPRVGLDSYDQVLKTLAKRTADPDHFLVSSAKLAHGEQSGEEISLRDGRTLDLYTAPIQGGDGKLFGRVWHFRDISTIKEISRMKNEFISSVSHELRTPLTSIRGSLDLLASGLMGELRHDAMQLAKVAQQNCGRLVRLINDVLDIEKIEAGRMEFRLETWDLEGLLERSLELMRPYGEQLAVGFQLESSAPGALVRVDADRLIQVLENLLSNAAKFSPPGDKVRIGLRRVGDRLRVDVSDHGPGIDAKFRDTVFEKFAQGPGAREKGGTGLGLHIARAIADRLGGSLAFTSGPEGGTTFHLELAEWQLAAGRSSRS